MPILALFGRGIPQLEIVKVLQQSGLVATTRAALRALKSNQVFVDDYPVTDKRHLLFVGKKYQVEVRLPAGTRSMEIELAEYPYHKYLRRHDG